MKDQLNHVQSYDHGVSVYYNEAWDQFEVHYGDVQFLALSKTEARSAALFASLCLGSN